MRLALGQINNTVGDLQGNGQKIAAIIGQAREVDADLVAFPELAISGYPPEDLLLNPAFVKENLQALEKVAKASRGITAIVGFADMREDIFNAAGVLHDGKLVGVYHKIYLPNYGVFDENRYFQSGKDVLVFQKVLLGLSGGIDSALTATIAVDALGKESVVGVAMPSVYSSPESLEDARALTENLGIALRVIPIDDVFKSYLQTLKNSFAGKKPDVTEENLQARIRGNLLMALSNKFGWLVLNTGNKSEMGVGYCTLYGDMAGGFAVIKDVPKTLVYQLASFRNSLGATRIIPERVMIKPPSAELRPNQKDTDSLPPYDVLDPILRAYVEEDQNVEMIQARGFEQKMVEEVQGGPQ